MLEQIREKMADRNLAEVARRTGIHANTLWSIKRGDRNPSYETLEKLAEYFGICAEAR